MGNIVGISVACSFGFQFFNSYFFLLAEMGLVVSPSLVAFRFVVPGIDGVAVDTRFTKSGEAQFDSRSVKDWVASSSGNVADDLDVFPKILKGLVRVPGRFEFAAICDEVRCSDGAVIGG